MDHNRRNREERRNENRRKGARRENNRGIVDRRGAMERRSLNRRLEDKEENEKVQCTYDYVTEFNRFGFAGVKKDGLWGVIDEEGNIVCECKFNFESEGEIIKTEFLGKYYKTYSENNVIYYSDETEEM